MISSLPDAIVAALLPYCKAFFLPVPALPSRKDVCPAQSAPHNRNGAKQLGKNCITTLFKLATKRNVRKLLNKQLATMQLKSGWKKRIVRLLGLLFGPGTGRGLGMLGVGRSDGGFGPILHPVCSGSKKKKKLHEKKFMEGNKK